MSAARETPLTAEARVRALTPDPGDPAPVAEAIAQASRAGQSGSSELRADVRGSMRNAAMLGASLLGTWAVALIVRIYLPRHLGPDAFGAYQFAEGFTMMLFTATSFGVETYVRKEVTTRPEHASEFIGGIFALRVALSVVLLAASLWWLSSAGKPDELLWLVTLIGVGQALVVLNGTYSALLHAVGRVEGLSILNVAAKIVWGVGTVGVLAAGGEVLGVAAVFLAAELLRTGALLVLAHRHLALRYVIDWAAVRRMVVAGLPYFVNGLALVAGARLDVAIMAFAATDAEVGWYGAATSLAGLALLVTPLIGTVLLPLAARAAARSDEELTEVTRRGMEFSLVAALPTGLVLVVGAPEIVQLAFGTAYAPAATSLQALAPTFVLSYISIVSATVLIQIGRGWAVTQISIAGMVLSGALNAVLIPRAYAAFGRGGAGIGAAAAMVIMELVTAGVMIWILGRRAFDRRGVTVLVKTLLVCLAVGLLDRWLAPLGAWRLLIDGVVYVALVLTTGAVNAREAYALVGDVVRSRRARKAA